MRTALVALLAVMLTAGACFADGDYETKWSQPLDPNGYMYFSNREPAWNAAVNPYVSYSDFVCEDGTPVLGVHWWGAYWDFLNWGPGNDNIQGFNINFYLDAGCVPGAFLAGGKYPLGACNETSTGTYGGDGAETFQYFVWLDEPFYQEMGVHYWIEISAYGNNPNNWNGWGWRDSTGQWLCPDLSEDVLTGYQEQQYPDRAYELVIPEPGLVSLAGLLLGAGALLLRRK
jgi:hypothetical protein